MFEMSLMSEMYLISLMSEMSKTSEMSLISLMSEMFCDV